MCSVQSLGRLSDWFRKRLSHQSQQFFALNLLSFSVSFSSSCPTLPPILFKLCLLPDFFILPPMPKVQLFSLLPSSYFALSQWFVFSCVQSHVIVHPLSPHFWAPIFFLPSRVFTQLSLVENGNSGPVYSPDACCLTFFTQVLMSKTGLDQRFCKWSLWFVTLNSSCL